jgi:hypothetical protein
MLNKQKNRKEVGMIISHDYPAESALAFVLELQPCTYMCAREIGSA